MSGFRTASRVKSALAARLAKEFQADARRTDPPNRSTLPDDVPRWKDGTAKDPVRRLEEELDEERFHVDAEYSARMVDKMATLIRLRHERDKGKDHIRVGAPDSPEARKQLAEHQNKILDERIAKLEERRMEVPAEPTS